MSAVILISVNRKHFVLASLILVFTAFSAGQVGNSYYGDRAGSITADTGFSVPEYDSQEQLLTELVAPFIFLSILLQLILTKVLHGILRDENQPHGYVAPAGVPMQDDTPNVRRYSMLMSVTITAMLVPSPFWAYVRWVAGSIGLIAVTMIAGILLYGLYKVVSAL